MEELEVTTHWIYILTPGALFAEHVTSIPKFPFDTLFLLLAYTYVSQAVSVIFPMKAVATAGFFIFVPPFLYILYIYFIFFKTNFCIFLFINSIYIIIINTLQSTSTIVYKLLKFRYYIFPFSHQHWTNFKNKINTRFSPTLKKHRDIWKITYTHKGQHP
jgi:hypothetical protein